MFTQNGSANPCGRVPWRKMCIRGSMAFRPFSEFNKTIFKLRLLLRDRYIRILEGRHSKGSDMHNLFLTYCRAETEIFMILLESWCLAYRTNEITIFSGNYLSLPLCVVWPFLKKCMLNTLHFFMLKLGVEAYACIPDTPKHSCADAQALLLPEE